MAELMSYYLVLRLSITIHVQLSYQFLSFGIAHHYVRVTL